MKLEDQAKAIRAEYAKAARSRLRFFTHGQATGERLADARKAVGRSAEKWRQWLDQECGLSERTALHCILLHRHWHEIEAAGDDPEATCLKAYEVLRKRWPGPNGRPLTPSRVGAAMTAFGITGDPARLLELITALGFIA